MSHTPTKTQITLEEAIKNLLEGKKIGHEDWPSSCAFRIPEEKLLNDSDDAKRRRQKLITAAIKFFFHSDPYKFLLVGPDKPAQEPVNTEANVKMPLIRYVVAAPQIGGGLRYWNGEQNDNSYYDDSILDAKWFISIEEAAEAIAKARVRRAGSEHATRLIIPVAV